MPYREIYLTLVSAENNNKFYHMIQDKQEDNTFVAKYGRVDLTSTDQIYPVGQWDKKYAEKKKKGYRDVTSLRAVTKSSSTFRELEASISSLITKLQSYSSNAVKTNYTIAVGSVTQLQLQAAQNAVDEAAKAYEIATDNYNFAKMITEQDVATINSNLLELYTVLPRKMDNVRWYLITQEMTPNAIGKLISNEQDILDSLGTQVSIHNVDDKEEQTIVDALGLEVELVINQAEIDYVIKLMTDSKHQYNKVYKVNNKRTKTYYETVTLPNQRDLFHSSRNANWLSILENGLLIRPSGVATTGSMLGDAIYFADRAKKSIGYSSLENSYWTGGRDKEAYLAVYDVRLGKPLHLQSYAELQTYRNKLDYNNLDNLGYNSVFADASRGGWLHNNEYTIYHPSQCTVKYLIEIRNP